MKYTARVWGFHYENGKEVWEKCYLTKDGGATTNKGYARLYDSEAEAWEHLIGSSNIGYDDERGAWSWVEEDK